MLADTDVLLWFFRGKQSARTVLEECQTVELSTVTYMELAQGARNKNELKLLRQSISANSWHILPITESVSYRATPYIESYALSHGMRLADALIAATSIDLGLTLITANVRHYDFLSGISLSRYRPYNAMETSSANRAAWNT